MEITPQTKVDTLLKAHPELEEFLMKLNVKYKKLKNPILRNTIGKVATLSQAAKIGGYAHYEFVNIIRDELNMPRLTIEPTDDKSNNPHQQKPEWTKRTPTVVVDTNKILDEGKNPLAVVRKALKDMDTSEVVMIVSDFEPAPLIDTFKDEGYEVFHEQIGNLHKTYIFNHK